MAREESGEKFAATNSVGTSLACAQLNRRSWSGARYKLAPWFKEPTTTSSPLFDRAAE